MGGGRLPAGTLNSGQQCAWWGSLLWPRQSHVTCRLKGRLSVLVGLNFTPSNAWNTVEVNGISFEKSQEF